MLSGGSKIATEYIQPNIGGDIALLKGIAKVVIEEGKHDLQFMGNYTNGSEEYIVDIKKTTGQLE
jgi:anaerobic selenocysteine-containing dehydrogenase